MKMIHLIWCAMVMGSLLFALGNGRAGAMMEAALNASGRAIEISFGLGAGYLFFCGLMSVMKALGLPQIISRLLEPVLNHLMPGRAEAAEEISMNLSMNMLGAGNAATPAGIQAMKLLAKAESRELSVRHDRYMLLILNATSIQLFPTTMLALRTAAGSANPNAVLLPTLICTGVSTLTGVVLGLLCRKAEEMRIGR